MDGNGDKSIDSSFRSSAKKKERQAGEAGGGWTGQDPGLFIGDCKEPTCWRKGEGAGTHEHLLALFLCSRSRGPLKGCPFLQGDCVRQRARKGLGGSPHPVLAAARPQGLCLSFHAQSGSNYSRVWGGC